VIAGDNPDLPDYIDTRTKGSRSVAGRVRLRRIGRKDLRTPKSLRDAFMRVSSKTPLSKYRLILAEDVEAFLPRGEYQELLEFESDIAQISELLLLFSESAGSLAELGAFVMDDEVAPCMMVVIDNDNYSRDSFIKLGPLYTLRLHHGEAPVCVLMLNDINLKRITDVSGIDLEKLRDAMKAPLAARLAKRREPKTFDKTRNGHVTKLITGLVQYYSALTLDEIDALLYCLEIPTSLDDIKKHLLCAKIFDWIVIEKR
jgi:hypothetical protein